MKSLFRFLFFLPLVFVVIPATAQVSFTEIDSLEVTPNGTDTIGAFARIFYHQPRNKYYVVYAGRSFGSTDPDGMLRHFTWREYDAALSFTGSTGTLPGFPGTVGDYAMVMVDSTYYHLTLDGAGDYLLTKYDDDFVIVDTIHIPLHPCDSDIDQLLNYTNGRLVIGAMQENTACPPTNPPQTWFQPHSHVFQYDLNLNQLASPVVLSPQNFCWGSSMIFNAGYYYQVTADNLTNRDLYAYKFDINFNYVSQTLLSNDGQWSQGILWDAPYYYVAYHTLDHNRGNVMLGVYDASWNLVHTHDVSHFPITTNGWNANRPVFFKQGNLIYLSFDAETYINAPPPINQKDWQARVKVLQVNISTDVTANDPENTFVVFPNPAADRITFEQRNGSFSGTRELVITDMQGREVRRMPFSGNKTQVLTGTMAAGTYFYSVTNAANELIGRGRFVKE